MIRPKITEEERPASIQATIQKLKDEIMDDMKQENAIQERIRENLAMVDQLEMKIRLNGSVTA